MSPMNIGGHPHRFHFSFALARATTILFLPFPSRSPTPLVATYIHRCRHHLPPTPLHASPHGKVFFYFLFLVKCILGNIF
jgi:hypothetical protein